ncbi:MAG TPA: methionyl aminopeptidase [Rhabdochlamydiaceae bacterium]|jgi:methionyl aminopeptidase|nr:methionyl aminopeptidase [Rhabdochlamydiaceae bacterium]
MVERNDPCWCGSGQKWKKCHYPAAPQDSNKLAHEYKKQYGILIKTPEQIKGIRNACKLAASILEATCKMAKAGVTTNELNDFAEQLHRKAGAIPAPLGYGEPPYPKSICTSLNEVICHGIPDNKPLTLGDIINIDVTPILNGYYGDCSAMVEIGNVSEEKHRVVEVSKECLRRSIAILKPGILVREIGTVIEDYARQHGCTVVDQFVGHGVGVDLHEPPQVPHHYNTLAVPLAEGMTFTIEPMINAGVREGIIDPVDQWTTRTADGKPSAQWEHTILITKTGHEILTLL